MEIAFLNALFGLCSCPHKDSALYERYLHLSDVKQADEALQALLGGGDPFELDSAIGECMANYERQGFVNGVRFGAMLAGELSRDCSRSLWSPEAGA